MVNSTKSVKATVASSFGEEGWYSCAMADLNGKKFMGIGFSYPKGRPMLSFKLKPASKIEAEQQAIKNLKDQMEAEMNMSRNRSSRVTTIVIGESDGN